MATVIKTLSTAEKDILASLVGSRLVSAEAALAAPLPFAPIARARRKPRPRRMFWRACLAPFLDAEGQV